MLVDTHCHLNFDAFDTDRADVIARAAAQGVTRIINPGIDSDTSYAALALAQEYESIYAAVGVHPNSTADFTKADLTWIESLAGEAKVVAIGEIGLDYYWDRSPKLAQIRAFQAQLELAARLQLPVIIHNREAGDDVVAMLEEWTPTLPPSLRDRPGVMHSFSAPRAIAERALAIGFQLGFTGPLTYKNADDLRAIASAAPLDSLLVETDAPFLTPVPHRGQRNEPAYIPLIVERLAALRGIDAETLGVHTTANAERLFGFS